MLNNIPDKLSVWPQKSGDNTIIRKSDFTYPHINVTASILKTTMSVRMFMYAEKSLHSGQREILTFPAPSYPPHSHYAGDS